MLLLADSPRAIGARSRTDNGMRMENPSIGCLVQPRKPRAPSPRSVRGLRATPVTGVGASRATPCRATSSLVYNVRRHGAERTPRGIGVEGEERENDLPRDRGPDRTGSARPGGGRGLRLVRGDQG